MKHYSYDAFISYRRLDGYLLARRLRQWLIEYKLPEELEIYESDLSIYIDQVYMQATDDFFENTIQPALEKSRHLIVVATPAAAATKKDGSENWVAREIRYFQNLPQADNISVALADAQSFEKLPADLHVFHPNIQRVNIRGLGWIGHLWFPWWWKTEDELLSFVASLRSIRPEDMPALRRDEERRRTNRFRSLAATVLIVVSFLVGLSLWIFENQKQAEERERVSRSQFLALSAERLFERASDQALVRAVESFGISPTSTAESALWHILGSFSLKQVLILEKRPLRAGFFKHDEWYFVSTPLETHVANTRNPSIRRKIIGSQAASSYSGRFIATTRDNNTYIYDSTTFELQRKLVGGGAPVISGAFNRDSTRILTNDGRMLWDTSNGVLIAELPLKYRPSAAVLSPDGKLVITTNTKGSATIWRGDDGSPLKHLEVSVAAVYKAEFSTDGSMFVLADSLGNIAVYGSGDFNLIWRKSAHQGRIYEAKFSPDSSLLVTMTPGEPIRAWEASTGKEKGQFRISDKPGGASAMFSRDSSLALFNSAAGPSLHLVKGKKHLKTVRGHPGDLEAVSFSQNGQYVLTVGDDRTARLWSTKHPLQEWEAKAHDEEIQETLWLKSRVVTSDRQGIIKVWSLQDGSLLYPLDSHTETIFRLVVSSDEALLISASHDGHVSLWDLGKGSLLHKSFDHGAPVSDVIFSPDESTYISSANNGVLREFRTDNGQMISELQAHDGGAARLVPSPDNTSLFSAGAEGKIKQWEWSTWKLLDTHKTANSGFVNLQFSRDGRLKWWSEDSTSLNIAPRNSWEIRKPIERLRASILDARFSPDGELILVSSSSGNARVWSTATGTLRYSLYVQTDSIGQSRFSPDGSKIVSVSWNGARTWETSTGSPVALLPMPQSELTMAEFSLDGNHLLTAMKNGEIKLFNVSREHLLKISKERLKLLKPALDRPNWNEIWLFGSRGDYFLPNYGQSSLN